jgi:hypothetical protein
VLGAIERIADAHLPGRANLQPCELEIAAQLTQDRAGRPLMLYNGATRQGRWRIGWIAFNDAITHAIDRHDAPLITPPPPRGDATDIAFAASALQDGGAVWRSSSVSDDQPTRALLRLGCGSLHSGIHGLMR